MFHNNIRGNFHILFFLSNKFKAFQISIFTAGEHSSISVSQQKTLGIVTFNIIPMSPDP